MRVRGGSVDAIRLNHHNLTLVLQISCLRLVLARFALVRCGVPGALGRRSLISAGCDG